VKLQIAKSSSGETLEFVMRRADSRQVEKVNDVYVKLIVLGTAAKAPTPEVIIKTIIDVLEQLRGDAIWNNDIN
jgi:4-hydroxy-3-methylbut-2-enyl diphosphate reductase IspH